MCRILFLFHTSCFRLAPLFLDSFLFPLQIALSMSAFVFDSNRKEIAFIYQSWNAIFISILLFSSLVSWDVWIILTDSDRFSSSSTSLLLIFLLFKFFSGILFLLLTCKFYLYKHTHFGTVTFHFEWNKNRNCTEKKQNIIQKSSNTRINERLLCNFNGKICD